MGLQLKGSLIEMGTGRKLVGKGKSVRCGGARTKGEGRECELAKKMLYHSDLLKLCFMKIQKISDFFPDTTAFYDLKNCDAN